MVYLYLNMKDMGYYIDKFVYGLSGEVIGVMVCDDSGASVYMTIIEFNEFIKNRMGDGDKA